MKTDLRISTVSCLLIFDPHQDTAWVRAIVEREQHRVSHLVLGGDYFDTHHPEETGTVEEMCDLLLELHDAWKERLTILLGNHDVHYMEAKRWCDLYRTPKDMNHRCSGYTNNKAKRIAKKLDWDFWKSCRLFQQVNGCLVSHAGIAKQFWYSELEMDAAVEALDGHCRVVLEHLPYHPFALLKAGHTRGGTAVQGGITWLDFDEEFSDDDTPPPQIVGHTPSRMGARQNGRSWCLDGFQSCYGILDQSGELKVLDP